MNVRLTLSLLLISVLWMSPPSISAQQETAVDYSALAQPNLAGQLSLNDQQRATVVQILDARLQALQEAEPANRAAIVNESNQKLAELLTPEQKTLFSELTAKGKLRFNFRKQKWPDVLDWFARQSKLSLVMDTAPEGTFTYSDSKDYSPTEAIDLLNSVLLTKGFTLLRKDRILLAVDTSEGIPFEMTPKVMVPELSDRGRFEIVTLELSIGERPLADCVQAASELIGPNGRVIPLGNAQKLLITETAGKLLAINLAVSAVPVPKSPPKPTPKPKPVLTVYPIKGLDPGATVETLQALFSAGSIRADTGAEEIHAYAPPETQSEIKSSVEKMLAAISNERKPQLQIYPVETKNSEQLLAQLLVAAPKAQVTFDEPESRLLVVANAEQQQLVQDTVKKLGAESAKPDTENSVSIYRVELRNTDNLTTLLQAVIPRALVISQPGRIAVRGRPEEQKIAKATIDQFQNSDEPVNTPLLKLYSLKRALDTELVESIRSTVPEATLTSLSEGKRLYALASARDQALIAATLKQLEQDLPPEDTKKLLVYPLDEIAFDQAQTLLTTINPDLQIRSDASGKRMLIWAMAREHEIIKATLEQLQKGLPLVDAKKLTVYPLAKMALDQVEPLLATIVPNAEIRSDSTGKRLLIWALAKEHAVIDATLKQLEQDLPLPDAKTLTVYPLGEMAFDQAQTLLTAIVPDAEIRSDAAGKRLLIWALKKEHENIANTLKQVNSLPLEKRSLTTYDLPMDRANEVLATVVSLLPDAQVSLDSTQRRLLVIGYPQEQELASSLVKKLAAGAGQPARVLIAYPLKKADPAAVLEMLQELQPDARFAADTRAKRILVTASLPLQARLQAIIEQLDAAPDTQLETVAQTYHIKHVTAEPLIELLESLYPDMKFVAEPSNRKLIVTGTNYDHQKLSLTLERIDAGGPAGRQVKTYPAGQSDPNQLANVIIQLVPTAVISTNTETKRLIIWADEDGHRAIGQAVEQFTQQDAAKARTLKTHPLPQAAKGVTLRGVTGLQAILELMQEALPAANISLDETNQRVIAWASEKDHQTILKMIKEFSKDPPANRGVHLKTHQAAPDVLRNAEPLLADVAPNARRVETTDTDKWLVWASEEEQKAIDKLLVDLEKQLSLARPRRLLKTYAVTKADISMAQQLISETAPGATILEGTAPQQILVQATEQDHGRIDAILKSLATVLQKPETSLHVYAINPQQSSLIQDLITKRTADATLLENVTPGQLVIQAPEGDHDIIAKLLEELSQKLAPPASRIQVYPIPKDQATVARELIQQVAPQATILESPYDNKLVVTALPDSHLNIATALKEISGMLKKPGTSVRVYPIDKDRLLAQTVLDHFDAALTADTSIQLNEVTNALIVRASTEQHSQIKQAVAALLEQLPMPARPTTQVYTLKLASAEAVQEALSPLVTSGSVVADPSSDSILVTANAEEQKRVADVVKQLDQVPNRTATVKAYRIKQADPEAIFTSLSRTFNKNKQFIIQFQPATSSVHLIATAKNHVIFQELMKELDQPDTEGTVVRVFPFDEARITAEQVVESLDSSLKQSLSLQVNEKVNSLIARGGEASQKKLQIAIDAIVKQLPMPARPTTQVYTLKLASAEAVQEALSPLVTSGSVVADPSSDSILVTANEEEQKRVADVVTQLDQVPNQTATVKAYRIKQADPEAIFTSLSKTFNKNKQFIIQFQPATSSVHLIATAKNHVIFQELMKELDQPDTEGTVVQVFPFDEARITAEQVVASLDESLTQSLSLQVNEKVNSLIARGGEASQKKLQIAIDAIVKQLPMPARPTTQVYALTLASAEAVQEALSPLVTSGSVVADPASGSILVTANEEEQKRVAGVVKQLDQVPTQTATVRAYRIKNTDPHAVFRSVSEAFRDNLDFTFNFQDATRSIYLVATPRNHALFKTLLEELDQPGPPQTPRNAKVYSLENVDGNVAISILNTLFVGQNIQIQFNTSANALVIIAADHQHAAVARALKEMSGVERILEVFPLQFTDPLSIETAVLNLYEGSPPGLAPVVSSDYDTQRIFVRGTKAQVDRIRQLLIRLGEPVKSSTPSEQKGGVRTIPFHGSTTQAVEQMEKVWNKLRKNRIQVVIPSQPGKKPLDGKLPGTPVPPTKKTPPGKAQPDEKQGTSSDLDRRATFPVAWQDTTRKQEPKAAQDQNATPASIVVVPGAGQITIASSDLDALDEMEKLLRAISQRSGGPTPNTTFSVFFLRNTGAKEAETLLGTLLEQLPMTRNGVGPIAAVADKRLNALVVHGSRKDRQIIQELLEVLDTAETLTQTMIPIPTLVPLKNTQAARVLNILRNVYRTQLSSTGGRKQVSIPEGVSDDVAALLQQMNASSAGPILSLDVDEKTNSIVIRALPDLSREVQGFIKELDTSARESSQRRVKVIQLENTRSDRMLQLLQQFLDRPSRSPATTTPVSPAAND